LRSNAYHQFIVAAKVGRRATSGSIHPDRRNGKQTFAPFRKTALETTRLVWSVDNKLEKIQIKIRLIINFSENYRAPGRVRRRRSEETPGRSFSNGDAATKS
jgi:hypothetical protein